MDAQPAHPKTDPQIAPLNCPGLSVITVRDILKSLSGTFRNTQIRPAVKSSCFRCSTNAATQPWNESRLAPDCVPLV